MPLASANRSLNNLQTPLTIPRASLGATTVGDALFTLANPSAISFIRLNADNSADALSASAFRTAIGSGTGSGDALQSSPLSQFAATTSAQLRGVLSDESGGGVAVFNDTPTLIAPLLGTPTSGNLANCTFPTLNQNTTGSAASLSISGQTGLMTVTGLVSTNRIKTVRDASDTILELGGSYTPTGTWTNLTLVTPALGTPSALVGTNITGTATGLTSGISNALKSATTTVSVSAATAPTTGQVLTATGASAATWQTPSGGGGTPTVITVADTTDATSFVALFESATGDLAPKTDLSLLYDASIGKLTVGLGGNVTAGGFGGFPVMHVLASNTTSGKYPQIAVRGPTDGGAAFQCYDGAGNASMDFGINHVTAVAAFVNRMTSGSQWFYTHDGSALDVRLNIDTVGNIVVGNSSNASLGRFESRTTSGPQLVGSYDVSNYWTSTTDGSGITTFDAVSGGTGSFVFSDPISGLLTVGLGGSVTPSTGFGGGAASVSLLMSDTTSATFPHLGLKGPSDGGCAFQMYNGDGTAVGEIGVNISSSSLAILNRMNNGILSLYTTVASTTASRVNIDAGGNVYVGTGLNTALGRLDARATTGAQLALSQTASIYTTVTVAATTGVTTFNSIGGSTPGFEFVDRLGITAGTTTGTTTTSALALSANSLTTGTGLYAASSTLTTGKLVDLQVSGTAAAASQTALNILTAGANATNAITTYGAQISNTHTNATSGTNVALYLNASGATTANYGLLVVSGNSGFGTTEPGALVEIKSTGNGKIYIGVWAADSAYCGIGMAGSLTTGNYNFVSSPDDTNLYINRPTGKAIKFRENNVDHVIFDTGGNVGIGTPTFGTSAAGVLALFNGTAPTTSPADTVQLFSVDLSAGNATLGLRTETAVVTETIVSTHTLSIVVNGTAYKLLMAP